MTTSVRVSTLIDAATGTETGSTFVFPGQQTPFLIQIAGTFVGTVTIEGSLDGGSTWHEMDSKTAQDIFTVHGTLAIRSKVTAYTSGTINVYAVPYAG